AIDGEAIQRVAEDWRGLTRSYTVREATCDQRVIVVHEGGMSHARVHHRPRDRIATCDGWRDRGFTWRPDLDTVHRDSGWSGDWRGCRLLCNLRVERNAELSGLCHQRR